MRISIAGNKIRLSETITDHLPQAMALEHENRDFIGSLDQLGHQTLMNDRNSLHLSIIDQNNDRFVGFILLNNIQSTHRYIEFKRFVVGAKRKGFGREALQLSKKLCFEQLGAHALWLDVFDDNPKAISLYESEGFVLDGIKRDCFLGPEGFRSQRLYSILETEYHANQ